MYLILRRNWHLFIITIAVIVGLLAFFGDLRVIAYTVSSDWHEQDILDSYSTAYTYGVTDQSDIFDISEVHTIEIEIDEQDFENMFLTYKETAEKEYYPVEVTIDGLTIPEVGIRLKGNSSLANALGLTMGGDGAPSPDVSTLDMDKDIWETKTPFLLKFDEYIDGQNYQGHTEIALRNGFKDDAYIREVLAYSLLEDMGVEASETSYSGVSINGMEEKLYVLVEPVNEEMIYEAFEDSPIGDLIKAEIGGSISYLGEDPLLYADNFEIKTNKNETDLNQLIEFFQFFEESTEEEFEEGLDEYIDVDTMLEYMVFTNFTVTMDSFVGNGNNYYLYEDPEEENFMIVPWDLNGAFGGFWHTMGVSPTQLDLFFDLEDAAMNTQIMAPPEGGMEQGQFPQGNQQFFPQGQIPQGQIQQGQLPPLQKMAPEEFNEMSEEEQMLFRKNRPPQARPQESENKFVQKVMSIDSFKEEYIELYEEMMEDVFTKEKIMKEIEKLTEIVMEAHQERNFLDYEAYQVQLATDKAFLLQRIEFVEEALYNLND